MADPTPLNRNQIAAFVGNDPDAIRAIERLFKVAGQLTPAEIATLTQLIVDNTLALGAADNKAEVALSEVIAVARMVSDVSYSAGAADNKAEAAMSVAVAAERMASLAATQPITQEDPRLGILGSMAFQDANSVLVTGGTIDGTTIGGSSAAAITGTTITATGDVTIADKIIHSGDTNTAIRFPAADTVTVETSGIERFRIESQGRVGLGVTNPNLRLQVAAQSSSASTVIAATEVDYLANFRASQLIYNPVDTTGTTLGVSNSNLGALAFLNCTNAVIGTNGATPLVFATTNTERMRILSGGNVGIGTTSPGSALSVNGNIDILGSTTETRQLQIGFGRTGNGLSLIDFIADATYSDFGMRIARGAGANATGLINVRGTGGLDLRTTDAAPIYFVTTGTERMRILSGGNVGIGTTNPLARLHVAPGSSGASLNPGVTVAGFFEAAANASIQVSSGTGSPAYLFLGDAADPDAGRISAQDGFLQIAASGASDFLQFATGGFTERMRITSTGNVGIGTASPASIVGGTDTSPVLSIGGTDSTLTTGDKAGSLSFITNDASYTATYADGVTAEIASVATTVTGAAYGLAFYTGTITGTNRGERLRIDASGNLGIGNSAPITRLHVTGATVTTGVVYKNQPAQAVETAAATLTIAELLTGIIEYTGALATLTMPTGTAIEGGVPATFPVDMSFDFSVINTGSGVVTLGTAAGLTLTGGMTVAAAASGLFRVRKTATNTFTIYRIS
jgi:hypothetical protein